MDVFVEKRQIITIVMPSQIAINVRKAILFDGFLISPINYVGQLSEALNFFALEAPLLLEDFLPVNPPDALREQELLVEKFLFLHCPIILII